jgi:hypothetical protein
MDCSGTKRVLAALMQGRVGRRAASLAVAGRRGLEKASASLIDALALVQRCRAFRDCSQRIASSCLAEHLKELITRFVERRTAARPREFGFEPLAGPGTSRSTPGGQPASGVQTRQETLRDALPPEQQIRNLLHQEEAARVRLPESHGTASLVLLPVNPFLVHAYWEIPEPGVQKARERLGERFPRAEAVLRFCDVTPGPSGQRHARGFFDVTVEPGAGCRYVDLWSPEKSYVAVFGFRDASGIFVPVRRSNRVSTPRAWSCSREEEAAADPRSEAGPRSEAVPPESRPTRPPGVPHANGQTDVPLANLPEPAPRTHRPLERARANQPVGPAHESRPANAPQPSRRSDAPDTDLPLDGLECLRRKYTEIYRGRVWNRPVSALHYEPRPLAAGPTAPEGERSGEGFPEAQSPALSQDLTQRCEARFVSGLSSAGSLSRRASDEASGSSLLLDLSLGPSEQVSGSSSIANLSRGPSDQTPGTPSVTNVPPRASDEISSASPVANPARDRSDENGRP